MFSTAGDNDLPDALPSDPRIVGYQDVVVAPIRSGGRQLPGP
jgi:hypothetical protein